MSLTTRLNVSGRKSDPVWEHFNRIPSKSGKGWRAICKQCKLELQGIVARLKSHREKCQQLQTELSEEDLDDPESVPITSTSTPLTPKVPQRSVATPALQKESLTSATISSKRKAATLDTFVTKTTSYEKANLDEEVAKMVFATNSSFRLVEHPQFCKMVGKLRPGYTPPTR
ncbi:uncharacterized protein [Macrobrachium rosenbergii]|uniref:uncharacterized protein isoform X2 n=1 Tax=Macrobrachium rosenbergii TaxID=79674 RepID=UPI0034D6323F